jgi:hypothetical protein
MIIICRSNSDFSVRSFQKQNMYQISDLPKNERQIICDGTVNNFLSGTDVCKMSTHLISTGHCSNKPSSETVTKNVTIQEWMKGGLRGPCTATVLQRIIFPCVQISFISPTESSEITQFQFTIETNCWETACFTYNELCKKSRTNERFIFQCVFILSWSGSEKCGRFFK